MRSALILGGYGNFGKRIAKALTSDDIPVIIAGRNREKAETLKQQLPDTLTEIACFDAFRELDTELPKLNPTVVINTCGPFQTSDYSIAESCIRHGVHYMDIADGRDFVVGISALDERAKRAGVAVIGGASTVPGLSSAVLENYRYEFSAIDSLKYGISPGQKAERGLATTRAILTYVGKPLKPFPGRKQTAYGWQDIYRQKYPELGIRWMSNCDIPDLDLLPRKYDIKDIQFSAGMESSILHFGIWLVSWLVRAGLPLNLPKYASILLRVSHMFDWLGTDAGGMHMVISGKDKAGNLHKIKWFIVAGDGDGPHIPTIPAIILAKKITRGESVSKGAQPCVGMVSLDEYMEELKSFAIRQYEYT